MNFQVDYLIIGGGIAGTTAAETIRKQDPRGAIALLNAEPHPLYSRVLLPAYMQGKIKREQVFLRTIHDYDEHAIKLFLGESALTLDVEHREIKTNQGNIFGYKKLLAGGGGSVRAWHASGSGWEHACRLQTVEDADGFIAAADSAPSKEAIVVGTGFIGMEFVNSLVSRGFTVSLVTTERAPWSSRLGEEGSRLLERSFATHKVTLYPASEIVSLDRDGSGVFTAKTNQGVTLEGGLVAVGVGLERNIQMYQGIGFEIGRGIKTNEYLKTGVRDVWAAGDIAEYYSTVLETHEVVGNWNNSFLQGRVAGLNMAASLAGESERKAFTDISTYSITVLGDHITFLGDAFAGDGKEMVSRSDPHGMWYENLFLKDGRLVGASIINKFADKKIFETIMRSRTSLADVKSELADATHSFADIIAGMQSV